MKHVHVPGESFPSIPAFWSTFVPEYRSRTFRPFYVRINGWTNDYAAHVRAVSPKRAEKRVASYVDPLEVARAAEKLTDKVDASFRFGVSKTGHGNFGSRADFCLVAGSCRRQHLTLFFRTINLIGGFGYDLCIIAELSRLLGRDWNSVSIFATQADVFALKGNSNEKLYGKLKEILV